MKQTITDLKCYMRFSKIIILCLASFMPGIVVMADTQTAAVDFTTAKMTNSPLAFSMCESGYGQGGTDITHEPQQQTNTANLQIVMMRADLGYSTPGDPTSTIICEASGSSATITGDQWISAIKAAGAVPEVGVQMNTANSQSTWVIDASNMVKHFNITSTSNRVDRWIIGNEPSNNGLTTNTYSAGFAAMFPVMKAVDPTIKIGGPASATYNTSPSGEMKMILSILHSDGVTPDFADVHIYGSHSSTDAALIASTGQIYESNAANLRSFLIGLWGANVGGSMPIEIGEWNVSGTSDSRMLENYGSVWAASAVGHMLNGGVIERQYADKNGVLGAMCETANESATSPSNITYNSSANDPQPVYHGIGMFTGESLFQPFGCKLVTSTSSTTNIEVFASDLPRNIVAINKTPGTTSTVTFSLTGLSSGTLTVWQKNSGANLGNYSTNVPVKLGTVSVSGSAFSYSLAPYTVTTFVYSNTAAAPAAPTGLVVASSTTSQINLSWNNNTENNLAGYNVYRSALSGFTAGKANQIVTCVGTNSYADTNLPASETYYYIVKALNTAGNLSTASSQVSGTTTNASGAPAQTLWVNFDASNEYLTNFDNPSTTSPCTETNAGGVTNSGAILVTGGDGNATYTNASWNFSANNAIISLSMMAKIQQATSTANKIQLGLVNGTNAGFADAAAGDGWNFGSYRLLPQSTTALTYQLAYQTATNGTTSGANIGSVVTLTAGHWYQFNTYFTNTGPGTSYNMAFSLVDYGTTGATQGSSVFTTSATLESITGTQATLSSDSTVYPSFRVANNTGASVLDDFAVNISSSVGLPAVIIGQPLSSAPQFGAPKFSNGQLTLTWRAGSSSSKSAEDSPVVLLMAANPGGPWITVTNAASPYTIAPSAAPQQFFRLQQ
ncbi:MAG TPA: fibronectin type III domain-containing protein [Verrucomicrobiae bacterium]|jgi:hypothetical protein